MSARMRASGLAALAVGMALGLVSCSKPPGHPDFSGLWQPADTSLTVKPEDDATLLSDEGLRRKQEYQERFDPKADDPSNFCVPHGMPWIMTSRARDYLTDITQAPDRIVMLLEGMDIHRIVYLNQAAVPPTYNPGTNGYSIGRWDGEALIIETTHLRPSNPIGPYQRSDQMQVTERWQLIQHPKFGRALEVTITATDPVIYRHAGKGYQLFVPAPAGSVLNAYGCNESLYDDHIGKERSRHEAKQ